MPITRRDFLAASGAAAAAAALKPSRAIAAGRDPGRGQTAVYTLDADGAGRTLKDPQGRVVLSYLTSKPEGVPLAGNSVCCIHPFNTPSGERATDIAPPDHRDHRGIFFAWHDMTFTKAGQSVKADFWGWGQFAPTADRVIKNREVRLVNADERSGTVEVTNDWLIGADRMLVETNTFTAGLITSPGGFEVRRLDLTYRFASDYEVTLNRMAFTGFCFRCRKDGPYVFSDSNGEVTLPNSSATRPESDWPARPWYCHTVTLPDGRVVSSAVVDHPANPPSLWHGARSVSFLDPCVAAPGPVTIPAGRPLTLRYLALTRDGAFAPSYLDGLADVWRGR
jgi:hypothetical protein